MARKYLGIVSSILIVSLMLVAVACSSQPAAPAASTPQSGGAAKTVKIGLSAPMTGNQAQYGQDFRRGVELAIDQLNTDNSVPGSKFELVVEDSKSDPKEAANVAQKFVAAKEVVGVVGEFSSTASLAAAPIYQQAGILMITPSASHPDITKTGNFIFRTTPIAAFEAGAIADWATKDLGAKTIALVGNNDDYGHTQNASFAERAKANGATIVGEEYINPADKDFKPIITKIRAQNPQVVQLAMFQVEAALFLQQAKEMGFKPTFISGAGLFNPQLIELGGDAPEGLLVVSAFYPNDTKPVVQDFVKAFKDKFQTTPSKFSAHAYDSVRLIADSIKKAGSAEPAKVRDVLAGTKDFEGVIGNVSIDKDRELVLNLMKLQVKNKDFVPWTK